MPRVSADVLGDRLAQLGQSGGRAVVGRAGVERLLRRFLDVRRRVEVGLADLEVDDLACPGPLERRARASTSNADSVPSRAILGATFMEVLLTGPYYKAWTS